MAGDPVPEAWVTIPSEEQVRARGLSGGGYDFGFVAAMGRLVSSHPRIAPHFGRLFGEIMFVPGALSRQEREMVAAVAAAAQDCHY
ncbi:MAG: carboxymuconolactone decarboxylase family protein [Tepidiformaceae bacterium]